MWRTSFIIHRQVRDFVVCLFKMNGFILNQIGFAATASTELLKQFNHKKHEPEEYYNMHIPSDLLKDEWMESS